MYREGANILTLSKGESEASEELDYARFMHSQLPSGLQIAVEKNQSSLISFPAQHSKMRALSSTEASGVGFGGATRVVLDEWEYHPYASQNYSEIMPMVSAGGQVIILSTVDKLRANTKFKEVYKKARLGENNFFPVFLPYNLLAYRTKEWYEEQKKDLDDWEIESKFPRNEEEALSPSKAVCRFDSDALKLMLDECIQPRREEYNGLVKIYKEPVAEKKYCFGVDPSEGDYDPSAGVVIDWQTGEQVAEFHGKITIDEQARIISDLYQRYNNAYLAPERNASGLTLIDKLEAMGVKNLYHTSKDKAGFWTSSQTRPVMLSELAEAVRLGFIRIYNRDAVGEFLSFIRTEKHPDGRAMGGSHDDYVMAWAIAWYIRKDIHKGGEIRLSGWVRKSITY